MGGARFVADTTAGIAGAKGNSTASVLVADIPDLLRKGSLDALGGQLDFSRDAPASGSRGVEIPPKVNDMGHYVLTGVVDFGGSRANRNRDPSFSASMAEWACSRRRANLSNGGIPLPSAGGGVRRFTPPRTFSACEAVALGNARVGALPDPDKILMTLHVKRGHASAQRPKRELVKNKWGK